MHRAVLSDNQTLQNQLSYVKDTSKTNEAELSQLSSTYHDSKLYIQSLEADNDALQGQIKIIQNKLHARRIGDV